MSFLWLSSLLYRGHEVFLCGRGKTGYGMLSASGGAWIGEEEVVIVTGHRATGRRAVKGV